jgi:hypothetical protein
MKKQKLIPLKDKIQVLARSHDTLEAFIKKRLFGFVRYDEKKANALKKEIKERIARQHKINQMWVGLNIPLAYNRAAGIAKERLVKIGAKVKKKRFDLVSNKSKRNGARHMLKYMTAANDKIMETVNQYFKLLKKANKNTAALQNFQLQNLVDNQEILEGTNKIIAESIIPAERVTRAGFSYLATPSRGEVQRDIKKLFQKVFGEFDFISITMKNGKVRNYKPNVYMKMLARTEMRTIQTQAVKDRCREYQNDLVQVSTHDDPCPICEAFEGQIYSLSGNHPIYPKFEINFPIHPNCEHNINPTTAEAIAIEKEHGKTFPKPYRGSVQDRIDEVRKSKAKIKKAPQKLKRKKYEELSKAERGVNAYSGSIWSRVNPYMRKGVKAKSDQGMDELINDISSYFKSAPKYQGDCYRLINFENIEDFNNFTKDFEKSGVLVDKAFASASKSRANIPVEAKEKGRNRVWLKIKSKTGTSIDHISSNPGEDEILFDKNTKFKLSKILKKEDDFHVATFEGVTLKVRGSDYEYLLEEF